MKVVLKNTRTTPATISLGSRCGARYKLAGEPAVTCPPSPCRAVPPKTVTIGANKKLVLATVKVLSKGDSCRAPMPSGSTIFRASVPPTRSKRTCAPAVWFT